MPCDRRTPAPRWPMSAGSWALPRRHFTSGRRSTCTSAERVAPATPARGGEWAAEAPGGRSRAGQAHPAGAPPKRGPEPTRRKALARWIHDVFQLSIQRRVGWRSAESDVYYHSGPRTPRPCGCVFGSWPWPVPASASSGSMCCCAGRGGASIASGCTGCIRPEGPAGRMRVRRRKRLCLHRGPVRRPLARTSTGV